MQVQLLPVAAKMGRNYCAVTECHNYLGRMGRFGKPVKLHNVPKERYLKKAWMTAISRKHFHPKRAFVCSDHFPNGDGRTFKHNVPILFLPQKETKSPRQRTSRTSNHKENVDPNKNHPPASWTLATFHTYVKSSTDAPSECVTQPRTSDQEAQTGVGTFMETGIITHMPEISIEDIMKRNEDIQFYTGFPNYETLNAVFQCFVEHGADRIAIDSNQPKITRCVRKLRLVDEFLMVMMRLRLGLLLKDLEYRFKMSASRISRIFTSWITFMCSCLQSIVFFPKLEDMAVIPKCFEDFSDTRIVLDCTEVFIQRPSSLHTQRQTYSSYKSHNTFKALVGIDRCGGVVFVSRLWGGCASDTEITRQSGLYDLLEAGDAVMVDKGFVHIKGDLEKRGVMVDKGFVHIKGDLEKRGVKLYCPPFLNKQQFSKQEVEQTRRIACARIHVERIMEQIKNFRILQGIIPLSLSHIIDEIFFVCVALTNILPPLIK